MGNASVSLFRPSLVAGRNQDVGPRYHTKTTKLLGSIEDSWWETRRHLRVQADFYTGLNLSLTLHDSIEEVDRRNGGFTIIREQSDQAGVPLVGYLGEGG